jgi:hypothetical protein
METGTQILIERMKTHPEEFLEGKISKWAEVMHMANDCLPDEDREALKQAYTQAKVERFNGEVLATLAGERNPVVETLKYKASERYSQGLTDPRGLFGSAVAKQEGQRIYDHNTDTFKYANAAQGLTTTVGSNGTSAVGLMPSAFGAVPRSTHE